jgi:YegS/Rv2252/BmrU family lipid kinase
LDAKRAKRAAIIYNPVARRLSRTRHLLQRTIETLAHEGIEARPVATTAPGNASVQARRQIEAGCDLILVAGGDGTINEVANGMLYSNVPLGILPGGTANVLARELGLSMDMTHVAARMSSFAPVRISVGSLRLGGGLSNPERRCFLCMSGAGLDAEIVYNLNLDLKASFGKLAYYLCGFAQAFRPLREFDLTIDGRRYRASFALMSRVRNYGGDLEIARGASLLSNDFEVVLFRGAQSIRYIPYLLAVVAGQANRMPGVTVVRGCSVTCEPVQGMDIYSQIDGELAGKLPATAEIIPDALTLLLPPEYLAKEQLLVQVPMCA